MEVDEEFFLEHFGVKGMRWGSRKSSEVSRSVNKHAKRDAKEYARAQAFYGQGAGTRRKLIKQTVDGKSKRLPGYSTAFHKHLAEQDTSKHAEKAVSERHSIDRKEKTSKRAGALARRITGEPGTQAAFVAAAVGGAAYLNSPKGKAHLAKTAKKANDLVSEAKRRKGAIKTKRLLNDMMRKE